MNWKYFRKNVEKYIFFFKNLTIFCKAFLPDQIGKVREELDRLEIPYEQNVSVPSTEKKTDSSRTISTDSKKMAMGAVTQFFFRDPDGYYIELCNCDVLTKFCFSKSDFTMDYVEGIKNPLKTIAQGIATERMKKISIKTSNFVRF